MTNLNKAKTFGSIEAGGTKFVCAVGDESGQIIEKEVFPTTTPEKTLALCGNFFKSNTVSAISIGTFGPIDINKNSITYGFITSTPKSGWKNFDFLKTLAKIIDVPMFWTTDVNSSAWGEYKAGAAKGQNSVVYFTIGTGIGAGAIQNGEFIGGISHTEMGHFRPVKHQLDTNFAGVCPFHGDCFEGLANGPSLEARTGIKGQNLSRSHKVFEIISFYAAQAAYNIYLNFAPARIIFGGSVLNNYDMKNVRNCFVELNQGYVNYPPLDKLIQSPGIGNNGSATIGNFLLAKSLL